MNTHQYTPPKGYVKLPVGTPIKNGDAAVVWNDGKPSLLPLGTRHRKVKADEIVIRREKL